MHQFLSEMQKKVQHEPVSKPLSKSLDRTGKGVFNPDHPLQQTHGGRGSKQDSLLSCPGTSLSTMRIWTGHCQKSKGSSADISLELSPEESVAGQFQFS